MAVRAGTCLQGETGRPVPKKAPHTVKRTHLTKLRMCVCVCERVTRWC